MEVIFLSAREALVKEIAKDKTTPYPLAKSFTSHHYNIEKTQVGLADFEQLITKHAKSGDCLHKGKLLKKIKKRIQSRTSRPKCSN